MLNRILARDHVHPVLWKEVIAIKIQMWSYLSVEKTSRKVQRGSRWTFEWRKRIW